MVVKKAVLDMQVRVDDRELAGVTAGIASTMERLQRKLLGVANVLAEVGKAKQTITSLAAIVKEAENSAAAFDQMEKKLISLTKSAEKGQRAFAAIKRMIETPIAAGIKPPPGGFRPDGLRPDLAPPPRPDPLRAAGGRRLAGIHPGILPAVLSVYSPAVIGGILTRYDPLLKDAAERYFVKDPRLSEYMLGTTPGGMYAAGRAGIDRARGGYQEKPPYDPTGSEAWRQMKGWGGYPLEGYPDIYYDSKPFRRQRDQQQQDPWGKHEFWAQKRYKRWREEPYGAGQSRRTGTQERPAELRIPQTETYEFVKGGRAEEVETAQIESLERIEELKTEYHEAELKRLEEQAETYASYVDPAPYIVEGLKSGEIRQAIDDFAVVLGTKVAEELVHKLIVMGIMAVLSMLTGGGAQGATMFMRRGGVIKAQRGLLGVLPPKPGGHYIPWGDQIINAAEAGQAEALGIFPRGKAGQDLILGPLAKMFDIPVMDRRVMVNPTWKPPDVSVETRPVNNITVQMLNEDRHSIRVHNQALAGKVNKAITVRR